MAQIQYLGRFLDMQDDQKISYTIQAQDLADVSTVASSVTMSFKLPKTINNFDALSSLSLPGDTSTIPYTQNDCKLYDNGTILINNGWLMLNSSDQENFNVNIENGIIDFFKAIDGKTIGKDLDLSETNHSKDLQTVISSFTRTDYRYIIADYNGLNTYLVNNLHIINVDYLVPSLNNKYIWDKIFNSLGYTYTGSVFSTDDFTNLWITYPKAPPTKTDDEDFPEPILRFSTNKSNNIVFNADENTNNVDFTLENVTINNVTLSVDTLTIVSDGTYNFKYALNGYASYRVLDDWGNPTNERNNSYFYLKLIINNVVNTFTSTDFNIGLKAGDQIQIKAGWTTPNDSYIESNVYEYIFSSYDIKLYQISQAIIDFGNEFLDVSISEYVKEIMIRFALTPFIDVENKRIDFLTISERLNTKNVVDWTEKYIERTNEEYTYNSYAQSNWYLHKYNDESATFNNGNLTVNNKNLDSTKDLYTSKFYSYNNEITKFSNIQNNVFPIWNREVKETINNDTGTSTYEVSYKGLSNRFYFIRAVNYQGNTIVLGSQILNVTQATPIATLVNTKDLSYKEIMNKYADFSSVLSDTRIHTINVYLDVNDLLNLDLKKLYYFSQENQYYLLNRITVDLNSRVSKGEFIRVKYN